jgi:hypothetical protein
LVNSEKGNHSDILMYQSEDGSTRIDVRLEDETVWLNQRSMAELFQKDVRTINEHIKNIFSEGELEPLSTIRKFRIVQNEGNRKVSRQLDFFNLDMIIAVGYRIRSHRGTQFRRWATERLKEYLVKGFVLDDHRLKEGRNLGADYFDELIERIRDIRASEKRLYRKICDIYSLSIDYDPNADITLEFFATVQNKLHYAVHGHTAAELITQRADADKPNMGLTSWQGKKVRKTDVAIAKNYLSESELKSLNRIVTMYLDYAEDQAERHKPVTMNKWKEKLDAFLTFNRRDILNNPGKVSTEVSKQLAEEEYDKFRVKRMAVEAKQPDEFDKVIKKIKAKNEQ